MIIQLLKKLDQFFRGSNFRILVNQIF
ncbi:MAG: hypothetical protein H6Q65_2269, partial [Firmicutes bacterium]|nr:hypothetical protein [Bacillota bacterium]